MSATSTHPDVSPCGLLWRFTRPILHVCVGLFAIVSSHARADQAKTPSVPASRPVSIQAYATDNPSCLEWTDGCTICAKSDTGAVACSTPGIACQPAGLQCKKNAR
jgi:hypothetical protein